MGRKLAPGRYWSIGPIVGGVMLATFTEPNYHPIGFWTAAIGCWVTGTPRAECVSVSVPVPVCVLCVCVPVSVPLPLCTCLLSMRRCLALLRCP